MEKRTHSLRSMFRDVARFEPPTPDEERALVQRVADGDQDAEAELVARNLRLVLDICSRYKTPGAGMEDLLQEGALGLLRAARRFDPDRGTRFSTFAHWWIRQGISRFVKGPTRVIRLPEYLQDRIARTLRTRREMSWGLERDAGEEEVGARLGTSAKEVRRLLDLSQDASSLESPVAGASGITVGHTVLSKERSPEEVVDRRRNQARMVAGLKQLNPRAAQILAYRYGLADGNAHSRPWIGDRLGISPERVRQIERKALRELRENFEDPERAA